MQVAIDISLYPLHQSYEPHIIDFIERLRQHSGFNIHTNQLSTQLAGDYDAIMAALTTTMKESLLEEATKIFVLKILNVNIEPGGTADLSV